MEIQTQEIAVGNQPYPVNVTIQYPERSSRLLALLTLLFLIPKVLVLLPHLIILWVLQFATFIFGILAQFAVLFTGKYPRFFFDVLVGASRWQMRTNAYMFGLTDKYPPFTMQE